MSEPTAPPISPPPSNPDWSQEDYHHPAAGWGAALSVAKVLARDHALVAGPRAMLTMNHEDGGFDCPGCAWPDATNGLKLDLCENGIKHVTWEMTPKRAGREFFAAHTVSALEGRSDFALEDAGRLTEPMAYDAATDRYVPIDWQAAFDLIGQELQALDNPNQAAFYTSGRLGNEATFLYALFRGIAKALLEEARSDPAAVDDLFIERHTDGFAAYRELCEATEWTDLERQSGLAEAEIRRAAAIYSTSKRTLVSWCLGVTQHEHGVDTVREIVNVLLLRGNIGREGAGPSPVRGHSHVQGNRTCGIDHRPAPEFLDRLAAACGIDPPHEAGLDTVRTIAAMRSGAVKVFVGMGGNFALAAPDTAATVQGLRRCELTVHVSTKLNRSHLVHGRKAVILPCLGRTELDEQASGPQSVTVEDSMSMVHLSKGSRRPPSPYLLSEPAIIAGIASATLPHSATPWQWYVEDYDRIRDVMACALEGFEAFNRRVRGPHGFRLRQPARELVFLTPSGRAEFSSAGLPDVVPEGDDVLVLQTMRSHDQWNTTIYSDNDRYRGVRSLRTLILMNPDDMRARGIEQGDLVDITATADGGTTRVLRDYRALRYDVPRGSAAGYMPEMNVLVAAGDYSEQSGQPLMKNIKVRVTSGGQE